MAGVMQDDAKLHKFCHDGKLEKIKVQTSDNHARVYICHINGNRFLSSFYIGLCKHG